MRRSGTIVNWMMLAGMLGCLLSVAAAQDPNADPYEMRFTLAAPYSKVSGLWKGPRRLLSEVHQRESESFMATPSGDGKWVAFVSTVQLVPEAKPGMANVYIRRVPDDVGVSMGKVELISRGQDIAMPAACGGGIKPGEAGNGPSYSPSISTDGRYIAFVSRASNLTSQAVCEDGKSSIKSASSFNFEQIYVRDRIAGTMTLVSGRLDDDGMWIGGGASAGAPSISGDGKFIAFATRARDLITKGLPKKSPFVDVMMWEMATRKIARISVRIRDGVETEALGDSYEPVVNQTGQYVAFTSTAADLIPADDFFPGDLNAASDIFRYTSKLDTTGGIVLGERAALELVSRNARGAVGDSGSSYPSISKNGQRIAFQSLASNLLVGDPTATIKDTNESSDIFVRDLLRQRMAMVSVAQLHPFKKEAFASINGGSYHPSISGDGNAVAFITASPYVLEYPWTEDYRKGVSVGSLLGVAKSCKTLTFYGDATSSGLVKAANCLGAVAPDENEDKDVFVVYLDECSAKPTLVLAASVTPALKITNWRPSSAVKKIETLPDGTKLIWDEYQPVYQALYGNGESVVDSPRALSDNGQVMVFSSTAGNLAGEEGSYVKESVVPHTEAVTVVPGIYREVPWAYVKWYFDPEEDRDGDGKTDCFVYSPDWLDTSEVYIFTPANPLFSPEGIIPIPRPCL